MKNTAAEFIKNRRRELGFSQTKIAELFQPETKRKMCQFYISNWETGRISVPSDYLMWIMNYEK